MFEDDNEDGCSIWDLIDAEKRYALGKHLTLPVCSLQFGPPRLTRVESGLDFEWDIVERSDIERYDRKMKLEGKGL